ncbi:hypothetical protein D9M72_484860 [compost metagenome]
MTCWTATSRTIASSATTSTSPARAARTATCWTTHSASASRPWPARCSTAARIGRSRLASAPSLATTAVSSWSTVSHAVTATRTARRGGASMRSTMRPFTPSPSTRELPALAVSATTTLPAAKVMTKSSANWAMTSFRATEVSNLPSPAPRMSVHPGRRVVLPIRSVR